MKRYALIRTHEATGSFVVTIEALPLEHVEPIQQMRGDWFLTHGEAQAHANKLHTELGVLDVSEDGS